MSEKAPQATFSNELVLVQSLQIDGPLGIRASGRGIALRLAGGPLLRELKLELPFSQFRVDARIIAHRGHGQNGGVAVGEGEVSIDGFGGWVPRVEGLAANGARHRPSGAADEFCG